MSFRQFTRAGVLLPLLSIGLISCGEQTATEPAPSRTIASVPAFERFENSPQRESRELLIDGRGTEIEWNVAGRPTVIRMSGRNGGGGGEFFALVRSLWTTDRFGADVAFYMLVQWPDLRDNLLEKPLVTSADVLDDDGNTLISCAAGNDALVRCENWTRSGEREDEVLIEIMGDGTGPVAKDVWRWGANTTDGVTPVNGTEFIGAIADGDTLGQTTHPSAGFAEDLYDDGVSIKRDSGHVTYVENFRPGCWVPIKVAGKGTRDSRLNRGKPIGSVLWETVSANFTACDSLNPIRLDDAGVRDNTWNPGDYVPSYRHRFPTLSQLDVLAKGAWDRGKWLVEFRRELDTGEGDDLVLVPGRTYYVRITIRDGDTGTRSSSDLLPLVLRPRS